MMIIEDPSKEAAQEGGGEAAPVESHSDKSEDGVAQRVVPSVSSALGAEELERLSNDMVTALKTVYDPEIPVDIYELGLIYRVDVDDERNVTVDMTLTSPACPVAGELPVWVENAVRAVAGVQEVKVNLVFDPPWDMSKMSEEAKVELNIF